MADFNPLIERGYFRNNYTFIILFTFLVAIPFSTSAQLDSLRNLVYSPEGFSHDTIEINTRHEYALELFDISEDSIDNAIKQINIAYNLAEVNARIEDQISLYSFKGRMLRRQGEWNPALATYDKIIALAESNNLELRTAQMLDNKSNVYLMMREYDQSLDLKLKTLEIFKTYADSVSLANSYHGIAGIYLSMGEWDKCIENSRLALINSPVEYYSEFRAYTSGNMALAYKRLNQPDTALYYFLECDKLSKDFKYLYRDNQVELARFYVAQKNMNLR